MESKSFFLWLKWTSIFRKWIPEVCQLELCDDSFIHHQNWLYIIYRNFRCLKNSWETPHGLKSANILNLMLLLFVVCYCFFPPFSKLPPSPKHLCFPLSLPRPKAYPKLCISTERWKDGHSDENRPIFLSIGLVPFPVILLMVKKSCTSW